MQWFLSKKGRVFILFLGSSFNRLKYVYYSRFESLLQICRFMRQEKNARRSCGLVLNGTSGIQGSICHRWLEFLEPPLVESDRYN